MFRNPQINTYVQDVEATVRFYTEQLGFIETFRTPSVGPPDHVEVQLEGLILGFASIEAARRDHGLDVEAGPKRAEVALWTDDVDAAFDRLVATGATVLSPPHEFDVNVSGRLRVAWIADPDGGAVQLVMKAPVAAAAGR
jgi:lactoylglutathione lyase